MLLSFQSKHIALLLFCLSPGPATVGAHYIHSSCASVPNFFQYSSRTFEFASTTVSLYDNQNSYLKTFGDEIFLDNTQDKSISGFRVPDQRRVCPRLWRADNLRGLSRISTFKGLANFPLANLRNTDEVVCDWSSPQTSNLYPMFFPSNVSKVERVGRYSSVVYLTYTIGHRKMVQSSI